MMEIHPQSGIHTWPGGWMLRHDKREYWRAYCSPRETLDHLREYHLASGPGGTSMVYAVIDDYGDLVSVPAP